MIDAVVKGIGLGLVLSVMVGPVFFALIETSIKKGFWSAFFFDVGILAGDSTLIFLAYKSSTSFNISEETLHWLKIAGGSLLIAIGIVKLLRKPKTAAGSSHILIRESEHFLESMAKGFVLNCINPAVLLYWVGVVVIAVGEFPERPVSTVFFLTILGTLFITDMTKAYLARFLRGIMTPLLIGRISRAIGGVFVIFGIVLLVG